MFCVAEFPSNFGDYKEVAVVHMSWFQGDQHCFWPPFWRNKVKLVSAVKNGTVPDPKTWKLYESRRVGNRYFDTYEEAHSKLAIAEEKSELSSDESPGRLRKRANEIADAGSDSDSESGTLGRIGAPTRKSKPKKMFPIISSPPPPPLFVSPPRQTHNLVAVASLYGHENSEGNTAVNGMDSVMRLGIRHEKVPPPQPSSSVSLNIQATASQSGYQPGDQLNAPAGPINASGININSTDVRPLMHKTLQHSDFQSSDPASAEVHLQQRTPCGSQSQSSNILLQNKPATPSQLPTFRTLTDDTNSAYELQQPSFQQQPMGAASGISLGEKALWDRIRTLQWNQELIIEKLNLVLDMMRTLNHSKQVQREGSSGFQIQLPLTTIEEFKVLHENLKASRDLQKDMIALMATKGGTNSNQITHNIMRSLMTDDLMVLFSMKGQTGKEAFRDYVFLDCIYDAVRKQPKGSMSTDVEIRHAAEYWLKRAHQRISKRNSANQSAEESISNQQ